MPARYARRYTPYARKASSKRKKTTTPKTRAVATQTLGYSNWFPRLGGRTLCPFPDNLVCQLKYSDSYVLTSTGNAMSSRQYMRLNSINDPDQTGTGHQPLWHDQLAAIYERYVVTKSRMKVTFSAYPNAIATANPSGPLIVGVTGDQDASISSTITTTLENSEWRVIQNALGGNNVVVLSVDYTPKKQLGLPETDDTVGAAFGSNPSAQWYGAIYCIEQGPASPSSVVASVEMFYTVRVCRIKDPSGS